MTAVPTAAGNAAARDKTPSSREAKPEDKKDAKSQEGGPPAWVKKVGMLVVLVVVIMGLKKTVFAQVDMKKMMKDGVSFVENAGNAAVFWYCLFVLVGVVCLVPTTPMELAGGFLFNKQYGGVMGVLCITGGTKLIANCISVVLARKVLKAPVRAWAMNDPADYEFPWYFPFPKLPTQCTDLMKMVDSAVGDEPWKMALLVRGSMLPLSVKNYGLGVTEIPYLPIAACSMIFTNFYAWQNIFWGSTLSNLEEIFDGTKKKGSDGPQSWSDFAQKMAPVAFNVILVVLLIKAISAQVKKQRAKMEGDLKDKAGAGSKKD